jgi:hypothetical protein
VYKEIDLICAGLSQDNRWKQKWVDDPLGNELDVPQKHPSEKE